MTWLPHFDACVVSGRGSKSKEEKASACAKKTAAQTSAMPPAKKLKTLGGAKASGKENAAGKNQGGGRQVSGDTVAVHCKRSVEHAA